MTHEAIAVLKQYQTELSQVINELLSNTRPPIDTLTCCMGLKPATSTVQRTSHESLKKQDTFTNISCFTRLGSRLGCARHHAHIGCVFFRCTPSCLPALLTSLYARTPTKCRSDAKHTWSFATQKTLCGYDTEAGGQELMPGRVERLGTLPMMLFIQFTRS